MYTCTICHAHNHISRLHCHACGTVPVFFSFLGVETVDFRRPITAAIGCERQGESSYLRRINLRTVELTTYAAE